jgi:FtsP/CotA-like multicopper oxidase with cupredoxin domain
MNGTRRFLAAAVLFEAALLIVGLTWVGPLARGGEAPPAASEQDASGGEVAEPQALSVHLGDLFIEPTSLSARAGTPVTITVHNGGGTEHNFSVGSLGATAMIPPGGSEVLELPSLEPGQYPFQCDVPGHADAGMTGTLTVTAAEGSSGRQGSEEAPPGAEPPMSPEEMAADHEDEVAAFPAKTKGLGGRPLEARVLADGTLEFELTASVVQWETEPGKVLEAWAYNGMVPGPTLRAELGDRVRIVLHNELPEPTALHLHGMTVPNEMDGVPGLTQPSILPGETFTYEFTVRNTGSNMYHSHFDAAKQVPLGLLGAFIVPDPEDPAADVDYTMVLNDGPLGFTLNGKGFPATEPIVAKRGQVVRIRYMNEGLQAHPMHLHGMPQTVIALDGHLLAQPYQQDTILIAPGQRVDVLVKATEPGAWAFHCHILTHAEGPHGMFGMVTAFIVQ